MSDSQIPAEPPPSYTQATGSSSSSRPAAASSSTSSSHLQVPGKGGKNNSGIPSDARRSMEDESRPLPRGWVRSFDPDSQHQFFVDTTKDPPRSIWIHPYDDETYLSTLSSEERERIEHESLNRGHNHPPSKNDITYAHTDDEDDSTSPTTQSSSYPSELPPRDGKGKDKDDNRSFGRKFKDKVTGSTHEEREQQRAKRREEERQIYEAHQKVRSAMAVAARTGQPQWIGKDRDGKDIYCEPPSYGGGYGGYRGGYGYNPYSGGVYTTPNARYIRPPNPYSRPYGYGYGGGYGMPLALGGGLLGGLLIGDALGGGFM